MSRPVWFICMIVMMVLCVGVAFGAKYARKPLSPERLAELTAVLNQVPPPAGVAMDSEEVGRREITRLYTQAASQNAAFDYYERLLRSRGWEVYSRKTRAREIIFRKGNVTLYLFPWRLHSYKLRAHFNE
ncbi:MAG TPA: hypothetical protein VK464_27830 [Symbiobacteriaceae bacterium]|jgi:hypothetical protein|nr:hypothetical protein [Symbiobacteriaceae bacterium]